MGTGCSDRDGEGNGAWQSQIPKHVPELFGHAMPWPHEVDPAQGPHRSGQPLEIVAELEANFHCLLRILRTERGLI